MWESAVLDFLELKLCLGNHGNHDKHENHSKQSSNLALLSLSQSLALGNVTPICEGNRLNNLETHLG